MKKVILVLLLIMLSSLYGCGPNSSDNVKEDNLDNAQTQQQNEPEDSKEEEEVQETVTSSEPENSQTSSQTPGIPTPVRTLSSDNGDRLILANKQYALSSTFVPTDLVAVDGSLSTNQGIYFKREAYDAYLNMLNDAKAQGIDFCICSTYRSYNTQSAIYNNYVTNYGLEYANKISAYPGRSEHQTGWAVDITSKSMNYGLSQNFINYPEGQWINANCAEYGFIIRYLQGKEDITGYIYEPWHLRYVGVDVAKEIMAKGITLEEYLGVA